MAYYLGKRCEDDLILFQSASIPTRQSHGHLYKSVIGPFKSKVGASYFARYGKNNPRIRTVEDVERLARTDPLMEAVIVEESMSAEELKVALECDAQEQYESSNLFPVDDKQSKNINQGGKSMTQMDEHQKMKAVSRYPISHKSMDSSEVKTSYTLAHFVAEFDEYVVIVSPRLEPNSFCKSGYSIANTIDIGNASGFPVDTCLRPDTLDNHVSGSDPDPNPAVEHSERGIQPMEDGWLEAMLEDRISGWEE